MRILLTLFLLMVPAFITLVMCWPALAQPAQYQIQLNDDQLNFIGKTLGKLPYEDVYQLINAIAAQVKQQQERAAANALAAQKALEDAKKAPTEEKPK